MRRVQVLIEDWHYQYLRSLAERKKTAISAELRDIITKDASQTMSDEDPLYQASGIAEKVHDPGIGSETIDERLYQR